MVADVGQHHSFCSSRSRYTGLATKCGVPVGLALASDAGILLQSVTLALLLHKRKMVSLASLDFTEMGRCLLGAVTGGSAAWLVSWALRSAISHLPAAPLLHRARVVDAAMLFACIVVWVVIAKWVLEKAGSALPRIAMRRLKLG